MAFGNYNNNQSNAPTNTTYSPISFANTESQVSQTRLSIAYFNRVMKISIAQRNNNNRNEEYATFDTDNQISVYVSFTKAKILHDMILRLINDEDVHNVCIELKNGLLLVSDGKEYGAKNYCVSIRFAGEDGHVNESIYECKSGYLVGAYNYDGTTNTFGKQFFDTLELDTFIMALDEYYKASSYAIAATVMEASMYKRHSAMDLINNIADKVGAAKSGRSGNYNNKTFLSGDGSGSRSSGGNSNGVMGAMNPPSEYQTSTFDDIASGM